MVFIIKKVVDEYNLRKKIYTFDILNLKVSSGSTLIAAALDNGTVRLVDVNTGSSSHTLIAHNQSKCICVQWSPIEENVLVSAG